MDGDRVGPEIIDYYTAGFDEASRLSATAHGALELIRTREVLRRHLPSPPAAVLDVGGGPGTHARWLAADGYAVHLVDPVRSHLEQAKASGACTVELGDARKLSAPDGSYDAVLLLGPLYHLLERDDRLRALGEARRAVRPGGLVATAAISRYAPLLDLAATARIGPATEPTLRSVFATGRHDASTLGFTTAYFHTADELRSEMLDAGFGDVSLVGVEGPAWTVLKGVTRHTGESMVDSALLDSALALARLTESDPALLPASSHFLALAHAPPAAGSRPGARRGPAGDRR
ncbi:MAG TPA: methyltransferase domain-containing protein [Streptosporangiaceae bacterium]|nr:methyltransferase domain-containing protein [Streptosporangiaceae bacterium]